MARAVDALGVLLMLAAVASLTLGVSSLADRQDLKALYWLCVGALLLNAASEIIKPRGTR